MFNEKNIHEGAWFGKPCSSSQPNSLHRVHTSRGSERGRKGEKVTAVEEETREERKQTRAYLGDKGTFERTHCQANVSCFCLHARCLCRRLTVCRVRACVWGCGTGFQHVSTMGASYTPRGHRSPIAGLPEGPARWDGERSRWSPLPL